MNFRKTKIFYLVYVLVIVLAAGCDQREDDEPYSADYNPGDLTTLTQEEGYADVSFPVNQLVVYGATDTSHDEMVAVLEEIDGVKIVGQVPSAGFYQVEVQATSKDELDQVKSSLTANEKIRGAAYNILMSKRDDPGRCPTEPDVLMSFLLEHDRLPYYQTGYQTALEIMQGLRDLITLQTVTIGIVEDGYGASGQFTEVLVENYSERSSGGRRLELDANDSHGTSVAGIICADNDGAEVNGMASTLIGSDRLQVLMARPRNHDFMGYCAAMASMIDDGGAEIINNSFGLGPFDNETARQTRDTIEAFKELMERYPDVLFVNAAPNESVRLNGRNDAPAGIPLGNTLTVSSWTHGDASVRYGDAGYGALVDMSAAGNEMIVLQAGGGTLEQTGCSYATPMVTSAAALLKSVEPNLSPFEIKSMLTSATFHADRTEPGGGIQLHIAAPLVDLLWEKYQNTSWAALILDQDQDDLHDSPELVETNICEITGLEASDYGSFEFNPEHPCHTGVGMIMEPNGSSWSLWMPSTFNGSNDRLDFTLSNDGTSQFGVEEPYDFATHSMMVHIICDNLIDDTDCTSEDPADGDFRYQGFCDSGTYTITRCSISERNADGKPKYLTVDLLFNGTVNGDLRTYYPSNTIEPIVYEEQDITVKGWINGVRVQTMNPFGTFTQDVEEACLGKEVESDNGTL